METRVKDNKDVDIANKLVPGWRMEHNYNSAPNGRIWILWDSSIYVVVLA